MRRNWQGTAAVVLLALIFGFLLGRSTLLPRAEAQGEAQAGRTAAIFGTPVPTNQTAYAPLFVVDSLQQSIMVYEYSYRARTLELKAARSYRFDKEVAQFNTSPSLEEIQRGLGGR
jgi:hypothetical protein